MGDLLKKIREAYVDHVLAGNDQRTSVAVFMREIGEEEKAFYQHFNDLPDIERELWREVYTETLQRTQSGADYSEYSVREKFLAFCFTLLEVLKEKRSFYVRSLDTAQQGLRVVNPRLENWRDRFADYANELLTEGMDTTEIISRPFLSDYYSEALWLTLAATVKYWQEDESTAFERTDVFVEKSVNFVFDLLGMTALDSAFDLVKFVWQSRK